MIVWVTYAVGDLGRFSWCVLLAALLRSPNAAQRESNSQVNRLCASRTRAVCAGDVPTSGRPAPFKYAGFQRCGLLGERGAQHRI